MRTTTRQTPPPNRARPKVQEEPSIETIPPVADQEFTRTLAAIEPAKAEAEWAEGDTRPMAGVPDEPAMETPAEPEPAPYDDQEPARRRRSDRSDRRNAPMGRRFSKPVVALAAMLSVLIILGAGLFAYASKLMGGLQYTQWTDDPNLTPEPDQMETPDPDEPVLDDDTLNDALAVQSAAPILQGKATYNILLLGLDTRSPTRFTGARSDVMMLLTLDTEQKKIKLTSFMRDIIVEVPGHGKNRLNTAFVFGGPDLTKQVLSQYFGLQTENYGVINFWAFADVIDALGGVTIDVKSAEIANMNKSINEINGLTKGRKVAKVRSDGTQALSGGQAIAYMRIRKGSAGGGDFERTHRQRTVLNKLVAKLDDMTLPQAVELVNVLQNYVKTDMTQQQMVDLAGRLLTMRGAKVEELRIPADGAYRQGSYNGMKGILLLDFPKNQATLQEFLEK